MHFIIDKLSSCISEVKESMSNRHYIATLTPVSAQHASPPVSFLDQLVDAIDALPDEVFAENPLFDIYAVMKGSLGPYISLRHRKAVMCEVLRVQAAFESDWNWNAGVDITNPNSVAHIEGEETGAFQVSFDSTGLSHVLKEFVADNYIETAQKFIPAMKNDHRLAVEYCARLLRINTTWCGTIKDPTKVISHVRRDAVDEFQTFLHVGITTTNATAPAVQLTGTLPVVNGNAVGAGDKGKLPGIISIANDRTAYDKVQAIASRELYKMAEIDWPHDGCAINLANLLQEGGIPVPDILQALTLGNHLRDHRGWQVVPKGEQQPGDIGSTCGTTADHGYDHIYLVLQRVDHDEMVIADNQESKPHRRFVSGKGGKTPTKFFLRAI